MVRYSYSSLAMKCPYCGVEGFGVLFLFVFLFCFFFSSVWGCMEGRSLVLFFVMSGEGGNIHR